MDVFCHHLGQYSGYIGKRSRNEKSLNSFQIQVFKITDLFIFVKLGTAFRLRGPECTCNLSIFKTSERVAGGVVQSVSSALPGVEGHTVFSKNQKEKPATLSDSALT